MFHDFITFAMNSSNWMQALLENGRSVFYFREDLCGDVLISLEKKLMDYMDSDQFKQEDLQRFVNWAEAYMHEDFRQDVNLCVDPVLDDLPLALLSDEELPIGWEVDYEGLFEEVNFTEEERAAGREFMREYGIYE